MNELTGEADPVVRLIDFAHPERNVFHAINQFRIDTPGCVKTCIIPDIVLFVNGIPLVVVEAKIGDPNTANPLHASFEQLLRYRNARPETIAAGLREGEPRLFYSNVLLVRTCGEKAEFGTITSGHEHFHAWKDIWPERRRSYKPPLGIEREQETMIQGAARSRHVARSAAHLHGVHGYRRRQTRKSRLPVPAIPRGLPHRRTAAHREDGRGAIRRGLAHAGLRQIAHDGFRRLDVAHLFRSGRL